MTDAFLDTVQNKDCIEGVKKLESSCVHLILTDIPYGISFDTWDVLHENTNSALLGSSPSQEKAGAIFKKRGKPINGWSEADRLIPVQYYQWCASWASDWFRVLKPGGSVFIFAGRRYAHRCIVAMEEAGFCFKDMFAWMKSKAPHRAQRLSVVYTRRGASNHADAWQGWRVGNLRPTFEPVLWFTKPYKIGTTIADNVLQHGVGAFNEAAFLKYEKLPDNILCSGFEKNEERFHPAQKPKRLMKALIELTTQVGHTVLDPFAGSGSTLVSAKELNRHFIGFEVDPHYHQIAKDRLTHSP